MELSKEETDNKVVNIPLQVSEIEIILGEIATIELNSEIGLGISNLRNMLRASIEMNILQAYHS